MRMGEEFGSRPAALTAAIGPAIGGCCYEVGPEVGSRFATIFPDRDDLTQRARIDLAEANRRILFQAGIPERQIDTAAICTACLQGELHSWRRDKEKAGRMLSGVCILG
jgi:polyphenol oxidase